MDIPAVVRNKALAVGAAGWLDELPALVASLEHDWRITVGRPFPDATVAFVAEALPTEAGPTEAGPRSVLKLMIPWGGDQVRNEITVLRLAGGHGCVRLPRADAARGALLLERLGRPLVQLGLPLPRRHEILCATAALLWRPAPCCGLPTGADKGRPAVRGGPARLHPAEVDAAVPDRWSLHRPPQHHRPVRGAR